MKSCKAEVNVNGRQSRIGLLSLVTVMILFLSVGKSFAADTAKKFDLWHKDESGKIGAALLRFENPGDFEDARKYLVDKNQPQPDFAGFVKKYQDEPFEFMQGVQSALIDSFNTPNGDPEALLASLKAGLSNLPIDSHDGYDSYKRRNGYRDLLEYLSSLPKDQLEKLLRDHDFLKKLFTGKNGLLDALLLDFGLSKDKKSSSPTPTPTASPTAVPTAQPTHDDEAQRRAEEEARQREEFQRQVQQQIADLGKQLKAVQQPPQQPLPQPPPPRTGEVDDSALRAQAQQFCDKLAALQRGLLDSSNNGLNQLKDFASQLRDAVVGLSHVQQPTNNKNNQLSDALGPLLQSLAGNNNQNQAPIPFPSAAPFQQQQQPLSQIQPSSAFNQPIQPTPPPVEPPPAPPMMMPSSPVSATQRQITLDLPSHSGRQELMDAQSSTAEAQAFLKRPVPQIMNPYNGQMLPPFMVLPQLQSQQSKVKDILARAQANLQSVKDQRGRLQDQLEVLKNGGESALPSWVKQEEQRLQSAYDAKKKDFDQRKQMLQQQMQQMDPTTAQAMQQGLYQQQQEVSQAEAEVKKFQTMKDQKIEEGNKSIQQLKSLEANLGKAEKDLQAQVGQLEERDTSVQQQLDQMMAQAMTPPQQPQQPTQNIYQKLQQMGSRPSRGLGGALSQPKTTSSAGTPVRGSLAGSMNGMSPGASSGQ